MSLVINGKLNFSGKINISAGDIIVPTAILQYVMGNSVSFNGQGLDLTYGNFTGALSNSSSTNYIFDTSADYTNGSYGNIGNLVTTLSDNGFVNHGPLSYLSFDGNTYVDGSYANGYNIPAGSSYTYFAVVRVNDFGTPATPTGGIVSGNDSVFGFLPPGTIDPGQLYPVLVAGNDGPASVDQTTQFQPNTWYAVAVTYDTTSQLLNIYVNGALSNGPSGAAPLSANEPLGWGAWTNSSNFLDGDLGVMTAWNVALTAGEVASYTTTYGAPYGITSARQFNDSPLQTYSQLYDVSGTYTFTVPAGVTSISTLGVGAGGSGSESGNPQPGGDTYIYSQWSSYNANIQATGTGTSVDYITFDSTAGNAVNILGNVAPGWLVTGTPLNDAYANVAIIQGNVYGLVTSVNSSNVSNVIVNINKTISFTSADNFNFLGQGILGAQGGPESSGNYNNGSVGPGPRAQALIGDGGGRGGVLDYLNSLGAGGGSAGGYGLSTSTQVAFDPNQTYLYNGVGNTATGIPETVVVLNNNNLTANASGNTLNGYNATGTYPISPTGKVMFSITQNTATITDTMAVGLCNYDGNIAYYPGGDTNTIGYYSSGVVYYNDGPLVSGLPTFLDNNQIIDLAVDRNNDLMWVRIDGGYWNGNVSENPATNTGGIQIMQGTSTDPNLYLMVSVGYDSNLGTMSINTSNAYPVPSGYTFIAGGANVGSTGGDGSNFSLPTNKAGQGNGYTGGTGGGGGGIAYNTGSGGGGTGLYGVGSSGARGGWKNQNARLSNDNTVMAAGGAGGSTLGNSGTSGGIASMWAGGAGGYPGGGGASGVDYNSSGNGGALAYTNDVAVTPGETYNVIVGQGGYGGGFGSSTYYSSGVGGSGAVRIVWPGSARQFPGNNVGIDAAGPSSITIGTSDFTLCSDNDMTGNIVGGYVVSLTASAGSNIIDRFVRLYGLTDDSLAQDITAFFRQAGMNNINSLNSVGAIYNPNEFNAYIFNVTWADSSTGKVRMSWNSDDGYLFISVINTGPTYWQVSDPANGPNLNPVLGGTFGFPATFTPVTPLIESMGNLWVTFTPP